MKTEPRPDTEVPIQPMPIVQPNVQKARSGIARLVAASLVSLLVGFGIGAASTTDESQPTAAAPAGAPESSVEPSPEPSPSSAPEPAVVQLTKADVALGLKILSKDNFGSAGSLIEYRIDVTLPNGVLNSLAEDGVWEVTYQVLGGEDGATIDTFTVWGNGEYEVPEGMASTPSVNTQLTLKVMEVENISGMTSG